MKTAAATRKAQRTAKAAQAQVVGSQEDWHSAFIKEQQKVVALQGQIKGMHGAIDTLKKKKRLTHDATVEDITRICHEQGIHVKFTFNPKRTFETFAMIYVDGKGGPTVKIKTPEEAREQARKLALKEQATAYVLVAMMRVEPVPQEVVWTMASPDGLVTEKPKEGQPK